MRGPFVTAECNAPIGLDRYRVSTAPVASQPSETEVTGEPYPPGRSPRPAPRESFVPSPLDRSGFRYDLVEKAQKILSALDAANGPEDMALPLLRFHLVDWRPARYLLGNGQGQLAHYIPLSRRGRA